MRPSPAGGAVARVLQWRFLGTVAYEKGTLLQEALRRRLRDSEGPEAFILLEHPHVLTLGRNADRRDLIAGDDWLRAHGVATVESDRGGQVTYHGPGQLIGYPIVNLDPDRRDLRRYVHDLLEVLVRTLSDLGLEAHARHQQPEIGVWVEQRKIASLGVHISRWITTHGFALNVSTDLAYFDAIVPCGLTGVRMASIESLTGVRHPLESVAEICVAHFLERFGRAGVRVPAQTWTAVVSAGDRVP